jgi:hypothetical protein
LLAPDGIGTGGAGVNNLFNPASWLRALGQPLVLIGLVVDLFPIYGVLAFGWNAVPLVMLYWMENLIAGALTLPRIVISGASYGAVGLFAGLAMSLFFVFHFGLFCFVHGTFLMAFIGFNDGTLADQSTFMLDIGGMFQFGMNSGLHVEYFVYAIIAFQVLVLVWEFLIKGEWKDTNPMAEMFAPYGRIIVLHLAIFGGAFALFLLGQPLIGVLALILFRAVYGVVTNSKDAFKFDSDFNKTAANMRGREYFEKALRGEKTD